MTAGNAAAVAAARVPAMTVAELARRLDRSFAVLAAGRRGAAARQQTLRATIDWSFQLLAGPEQALLVRLAVFAGGATLEAAEAVCGGEGIDPDAVFELLAGLVARSLVVAEEKGPGTRYRLLETIRQYGEERLEQAGEADRWRARHASYYAGLLTQVRDHAHDPDQDVFWAVRVSADQDNLPAAWKWAIGAGNVDTAFQMLAGFAPLEVWSTYPLMLAGEPALELPGATKHPGYPLAAAVSALFAANRGDVTGAQELCRRAGEANAVLALDRPEMLAEAYALHESSAGASLHIGPFRAGTRLFPHSAPNADVRPAAGHAALMYAGDSGPSPHTAELADGAGLLVAEASYIDRVPEDSRQYLSGARQVGREAARVGAGRLLLTHLLPGTDYGAAQTAASAEYGGPVDVATPGLVLDLDLRVGARLGQAVLAWRALMAGGLQGW